MANNKFVITQTIVDLLPASDSTTVDTALKTWYVNIRAHGGMRLTAKGYQNILAADIANWTWHLPGKQKIFSKRLLLDLDQKLKWPYYIDSRARSVIFFSSREAMLANLYGDLELFLKQYS
jgi:hypothetical protein